jgi:hypothetical protein
MITVKNHQCARLTRWGLKHADYEFEIMHRPGKKHLNADVLSRHVAAAVLKHHNPYVTLDTEEEPRREVSLSKEDIRQTQAKD